MGGQSYKCPMCDKWVLRKGALRDHVRAVHNLVAFEIEAVGPATRIVGGRPPAASR